MPDKAVPPKPEDEAARTPAWPVQGPPPAPRTADAETPPKLGFTGSIIYGISKIIDSVWGGAAKVIATFKDLNQSQAMVSIMAITMVLGALGATTAVGAMAYVCRIVVNQPSQGADANAALIRYMNERDERNTAEKERDYERSRRRDDNRDTRDNENLRKMAERLEKLDRSIDISTKTNEKVAAALERMNNKMPDPAAPVPRAKADIIE